MRQTPWFERRFPAIEDNGRLPGILMLLEGTVFRLQRLIEDATHSAPVDSGWSVAQHIGHLGDLEPLWLQRAREISQGKEHLTAADLTNRATHEAGHDQQPLPVLVDRFASARAEFVRVLRDCDHAALSQSARHPRLGTPMRVIDLAYFVAEHDDHHLAMVKELLS
jgi:hypothetical protein